MSWNFNEASLPSSTKFLLQQIEWNPSGQNENGEQGVFELYGEPLQADATVSESYNMSINAPRYPVEGGIPLSNRGGMTGYSISISAVTSNTKLSLIDSFLGSEAIEETFNSSAFGQNFTAETRVQKHYRILYDWARRGNPLYVKTIYARNGYYEDNGDISPFQITGFGIQRDGNTGDAIGYSLTLERIFIARIAKGVNQGLTTTVESQIDTNERPILDPSSGPQVGRMTNAVEDGAKVNQGTMQEYLNILNRGAT